jgi:formamidopyrimidine-DNA glycosylase
MPELPEVQTTVNGLRRHIIGLTIIHVWSDYGGAYFKDSDTIKNPMYFKNFKKEVLGKMVVSVERRAKNILINLSTDKTILVHMKMTGHLLYGRYRFRKDVRKDPWDPIEPESLKDPYNRHVHLMFTFDDHWNLALSDVRTFAKVVVMDSKTAHESVHLNDIGPEPLEKSFTFEKFSERIDLRPNGKIKQILMDQSILAGIGNIYADESLWLAGIHPLELVRNIPTKRREALFKAVKETLRSGIDFGGDSMSDYRNVNGEKGEFQGEHHAYRRTGEKCDKPGCGGTIMRLVVGGRSAHFCSRHQRLTVR